MSYHNQLFPWCIIRSLPNARTLIVARFQRCGEAEAHLKILNGVMPNDSFGIMFDPGNDQGE